MTSRGVSSFLSGFGMGKYSDIFLARGYDQESDICYLTSHDLEHCLMIASQKDRDAILRHAQQYVRSKEHSLYQWLRGHFLDHYFIGFVQSELTDLVDIAKLHLPNEELYDELEIVLPGHRRRLERAVSKLQRESQTDAERPVTQGWWGRPLCLPHAKFDFLCVRAQLFNPQQPGNKVDIDFMVDSGSDVCTVQESSVSSLSLELLGSVYSCGIHGGNHTNLYRATLMLGDHRMDIEVLVSNYDSLGSRVVRNFRHIINGDRHIWLKGDYQDPLPACLPLPAPVPEQQPSSLPSTTLAVQSQRKALPRPGVDLSCDEEFSEIMKRNKRPNTSQSLDVSRIGDSAESITISDEQNTSHTAQLGQGESFAGNVQRESLVKFETVLCIDKSTQNDEQTDAHARNTVQASCKFNENVNIQISNNTIQTNAPALHSNNINQTLEKAKELLKEDVNSSPLHSLHSSNGHHSKSHHPIKLGNKRITSSHNDVSVQVKLRRKEDTGILPQDSNLREHSSVSNRDSCSSIQLLSQCEQNESTLYHGPETLGEDAPTLPYTQGDVTRSSLVTAAATDDGRVSLKLTMPTHLRDTDDDVDHHRASEMSDGKWVVSGQSVDISSVEDDVVHILCEDEDEDEDVHDNGNGSECLSSEEGNIGLVTAKGVVENHSSILFLSLEDLK